MTFDDLLDNHETSGNKEVSKTSTTGNNSSSKSKFSNNSTGLAPTSKRGHHLNSGLKKNVYKSTILGQAIAKLREKKKFVDDSSDADVEDELSESDMTLTKPKLVRKSPEKNKSDNYLNHHHHSNR